MASKRQFAVLGLGRFGISAALTLENMGYEVLGADMDTNVVANLSEKLSQVVSFDMRDARAMDQVGIGSRCRGHTRSSRC
ncbi:MAG: NAD-binding protein [Selenomonas sp.]|nr:NAD-binding protein [Selenomonas sp.]